MSRTARLFQLMQTLRQSAPPVRAENLADEMGVSLRTIYRDIDELRALGALIDGEAGFGYTLIEDATLPPLGFDDEEIEALVLGLREVGQIGDHRLLMQQGARWRGSKAVCRLGRPIAWSMPSCLRAISATGRSPGLIHERYGRQLGMSLA